jgi:adenylyltransferase/sulfurtransferase
MLQAEELQRYSRHLSLAEIGQIGQEKIKKASVLVVGAGGLGCPVLQYLTAAGVGKIGIVDADKVDITNLQRQILYGHADIGQPKALVAREKLQKLNNWIDFEVFDTRLHKENALAILVDYQIVVDCTDNFATRYLINDACVILDKPLVFGAIFKFEGQVSVFNLKNAAGEAGATYRCLFPNLPKADEVPNCAEAGVLGVLPGIIGTLQANEVLKIILGIGEALRNRLLLVDALTLQTRVLKIKRSESQAQVSQLIDYEEVCNAKPTNNALKSIAASVLKSQLDAGIQWQIVDVREEYEYEICHLEGAHLFPMGEILKYATQIDCQKPVAVYCHHGMRSLLTIKMLEKEFGFQNLYNLSGGIDAWAREVETDMAVY